MSSSRTLDDCDNDEVRIDHLERDIEQLEKQMAHCQEAIVHLVAQLDPKAAKPAGPGEVAAQLEAWEPLSLYVQENYLVIENLSGVKLAGRPVQEGAMEAFRALLWFAKANR